MSRHRTLTLLVLVSIVVCIGCSADSPTSPGVSAGPDVRLSASADYGRWLWGVWQIGVDLDRQSISASPLRTADMHFNVVPLMNEGTPLSALSFSNLMIDGSGHRLQVDISLKHPFPTLPQVPGFDVHGILFTRGDAFTLGASGGIMTGPTEPRLVNADGYTRWWNPDEFKGPSLLGYSDGHYGTPFITGAYQVNIAGYKYFADGLGALDTLEDLDADDRGVFRAGSENTRRYLIDFGTEAANFLVFNYAVDANWGRCPTFVPGGPAPEVPDDFPLTANSPEPYRIRVSESSNTLSATTAGGTSGTVHLNVDVFDWQALDALSTVPMEVSIVQVEAPIFGLGPVTAAVVPGSGADGNMSTYTATIAAGCPEKLDEIDIVVTATCSYGDYQNDVTYFLGAEPLQAFFVYQAKVLDGDTYSGWTLRYERLLYPEQPDQGSNYPDIAVYSKAGETRAVTIDQPNPDPNGDGDHMPDSINEWANEYETYSMPEHYHMPLDMLSDTGLWNDFRGITICDSGSTMFFSNTNIHDEFPTGETDPLYSYFTWVSHAYLGNAAPDTWNTIFFSDGDYPRYWATDPSNGVSGGTDYVYSVFLYDVTGMSGSNPAPDPQRYIIMRWEPPYEATLDSVDWQRPDNVPPNGVGIGYVDRDKPYEHRLAVDDSGSVDRFYMLDSHQEIEVVDCDFTQDEFSGYTPIGTVPVDNWPLGVSEIVDIEVVQTKSLGTSRNHVAAVCKFGSQQWVVWVFDYDSSQPAGSQAVTQWLSDPFSGIPCALDALDSPVEVHVLHQNGPLIYVSVFRDYP